MAIIENPGITQVLLTGQSEWLEIIEGSFRVNLDKGWLGTSVPTYSFSVYNNTPASAADQATVEGPVTAIAATFTAELPA